MTGLRKQFSRLRKYSIRVNCLNRRGLRSRCVTIVSAQPYRYESAVRLKTEV